VSAPDTIAAVASAPGRAAVGIVRVSGSAVPELARGVLGVLPPARRAHLCTFRAADGSAIDTGLALYFPAPYSYTGEPVLELQGHGGVVVLDLLLKRLLELGCRVARPGEFSERAFLNGKMDIAQAEAVADLIDAGSAAAARAAHRSLSGAFSLHIGALQDNLKHLRTLVEAAIDFPDEDLDFASHALVQQHLKSLFEAFDRIQSAARQGAVLSEGLNVVIAGRPNAGKSSLLNRLAGRDVAIVTEQPGTTRDVLRQTITLDALTINLSDTAGLRATSDAAEAEGVRRAHQEIGAADVVLFVTDALSGRSPREVEEEVQGAFREAKICLVFSKMDRLSENARQALAQAPGVLPRLALSALSGEGVAALTSHLKSVAGLQGEGASLFSARRRHLDALSRARRSVEAAAHALSASAVELFAEDLRQAQLALSEITGEFTSDDLLGEIFGRFCIGK
jgi:tRNA modification GTPase